MTSDIRPRAAVVLPALVALLVPAAVRPVPEATAGSPVAAAVRADIYSFPLRPTNRARAASGRGELKIAQSPFGVAMTAEGYIVYDITVSTRGLRPASVYGAGATYTLWITTPELDRTEKLGVLEGNEFRGRIATMNKFLLMVTVEAGPDAEKRRGPIMLRGTSPSGLMSSFASHELFNNMPHE